MKSPILASEAEAELEEALEYYQAIREELARRLAAEVAEAIERISRRPRSFPSHEQTSYRKCILTRFPYTLFFLERDEDIWIAAIAHQKRNPGYWTNRQPDSSDIDGEEVS